MDQIIGLSILVVINSVLVLFVGMMMAPMIVSYTNRRVEKQKMLQVAARKCPHCAEVIRLEAKLCRFCGQEVLPPQAFQAVLNTLLVEVDSATLEDSAESYYKQGLRLCRLGHYTRAAGDFAKALKLAPSESRWSKVARSRLYEIYNNQLRGWW